MWNTPVFMGMNVFMEMEDLIGSNMAILQGIGHVGRLLQEAGIVRDEYVS